MKYLFWGMGIGALLLACLVRFMPQIDHPQPFLAVGMKPQVLLMRDIASDHGWGIGCEGQTGRMSVVRFEPGFLPWISGHEEVWNDVATVSTSLSSTHRKSDDDSCGWEESSYESGPIEGELILGVGPKEELIPLLKIAESCEVNGARLTEGPPVKQEVYPGEVPKDWVGISINGDINTDTGPLMCLTILANRKLTSHNLTH